MSDWRKVRLVPPIRRIGDGPKNFHGGQGSTSSGNPESPFAKLMDYKKKETSAVEELREELLRPLAELPFLSGAFSGSDSRWENVPVDFARMIENQGAGAQKRPVDFLEAMEAANLSERGLVRDVFNHYFNNAEIWGDTEVPGSIKTIAEALDCFARDPDSFDQESPLRNMSKTLVEEFQKNPKACKKFKEFLQIKHDRGDDEPPHNPSGRNGGGRSGGGRW